MTDKWTAPITEMWVAVARVRQCAANLKAAAAKHKGK